MKRLLTLALAVFALPLAVFAQAGGWTVMGRPHPLVTDPNPIIEPWAGYTNEIYTYIDATGVGTNESPIVAMSTLTNFPSFAPDSLDMKYGTWYGTNGVDFPFGGQEWRVGVGTHLTNNPGELVWAYTTGSPLPLHITPDMPQIYFMNFVATVGGWGGGSNTTFYYKTNCYGCSAATPTWAVDVGASPGARAYGTCVDQFSNVYVAGTFSLTLTNGSTGLIASGAQDCFVAKYTPLGQLQWLKQLSASAGGNVTPAAGSLCCGTNGDIYLGGYFYGNPNASVTLDGITLTNSGHDAMFVTRLSATNGAAQWAFAVTNNTYNVTTTAMAVDKNTSEIYVAGNFQGTTDFSSGLGTPLNSSMGGTDAFLAKYRTDGVWEWSTNYPNSGGVQFLGIGVDSGSYVNLVGNFAGAINLGGTTLLAYHNGISYQTTMFLARFNPAMLHQWSKSFSTGVPHQGAGNSFQSAGFASDGTLYVVGQFTDGTLNLGTTNIITTGGYGGTFLLKVNSDSTTAWAQVVAAYAMYNASVFAQATTIDSVGGVGIAMYYASDLTLNNGTVIPHTGFGNYNMVLLKYNNGAYQWYDRGSTPGYLFPGWMVVDSGNCLIGCGSFNSASTIFGTQLSNSGGFNPFLFRHQP